MKYLYHIVPHNFEGDVLLPLNMLKNKYPEVYEEHFKKYVGREAVTQQHIPFLNCLWNDVLHFTAVHPSVIRDTLLELGVQNALQNNFYEINPNLLEPENTIVYLYKYQDLERSMREDNFERYSPEVTEKYSQLPLETKKYYREKIQERKKPLLFHGVPHILYKGSLDVSKLMKI